MSIRVCIAIHARVMKPTPRMAQQGAARKHVQSATTRVDCGRMPLAAGTRLGQYEIVTAIGAGGMGACGRPSELRESRPSCAGVGPRAIGKK